jgi:hypothetical protein
VSEYDDEDVARANQATVSDEALIITINISTVSFENVDNGSGILNLQRRHYIVVRRLVWDRPQNREALMPEGSNAVYTHFYRDIIQAQRILPLIMPHNRSIWIRFVHPSSFIIRSL